MNFSPSDVRARRRKFHPLFQRFSDGRQLALMSLLPETQPSFAVSSQRPGFKVYATAPLEFRAVSFSYQRR